MLGVRKQIPPLKPVLVFYGLDIEALTFTITV